MPCYVRICKGPIPRLLYACKLRVIGKRQLIIMVGLSQVITLTRKHNVENVQEIALLKGAELNTTN